MLNKIKTLQAIVTPVRITVHGAYVRALTSPEIFRTSITKGAAK
jgi:hypothetical protein